MEQLVSSNYQSEDVSPEPSIADLLNSNSKSLLLGFQRMPLDRPAYGCYELNARFQYGFSQDFDKNLLSVRSLTYQII